VALGCALLMATAGHPRPEPSGGDASPLSGGGWEIQVQVDDQGTRVHVHSQETSLRNPQGEVIVQPGEAGIATPRQAPEKLPPGNPSPASPSPGPPRP